MLVGKILPPVAGELVSYLHTVTNIVQCAVIDRFANVPHRPLGIGWSNDFMRAGGVLIGGEDADLSPRHFFFMDVHRLNWSSRRTKKKVWDVLNWVIQKSVLIYMYRTLTCTEVLKLQWQELNYCIGAKNNFTSYLWRQVTKHTVLKGGIWKRAVVRGLKSLSVEFCFISHGNLGEDRVKSTSWEELH